MLERCSNRNLKDWPRYGGRGIQVCARWKRFENFLLDMGERPAGKTLDRFPDNDGNYEPGNCRWATPTEQANHRRPKRCVLFLTARGKTQPIQAWADEVGVRYLLIYQRVQLGWAPERAIFTAPGPQGHRHTHGPVMRSISQKTPAARTESTPA